MQHDSDRARMTQAEDDTQVTGRVKLFTVDNTEKLRFDTMMSPATAVTRELCSDYIVAD